ncbi:MAG: hypothetical protein WCG97_03665 [bacterium]
MKFKKIYIVPGILVLVMVAFCYAYLSPFSYKPTSLSKNWSTYNDNKYGFHIKYQPGLVSSLVADAPGSPVTFYVNDPNSGGEGELSILTYKGSIDTVADKGLSNFGENCVLKDKFQSVNGLKAKKIDCTEDNHTDSGEIRKHHVFLFASSEDRSLLYQLIYDKSEVYYKNKRVKTSVDLGDIIEEMIGTFGLNDRNQEYQTYTDSRGDYSITYPSEWSFEGRFGPHSDVIVGDAIALWHPEDQDRIRLEFVPNTYFRNFMVGRESLGPCTEKKELFSKKIVGRECKWGNETDYFFEKDNNLYNLIVENLLVPGKIVNKKQIEDILNSFILKNI